MPRPISATETAARSVAAIALGLLLIGAAGSPGHVPEPDGLWQGVMRGYTPNSVKGARVLDTAALVRLIEEKNPVLLDVGPADKKPASISPATPWMPAHRSIPGAVWMPGGGSGTPNPQFSESFRSRVTSLTGGDIERPIVTFCHPECWGSWNAAKRLVGYGYSNVYWYPEGLEGWQAEREPVTVAPDPAWALAAPADQPK
ncbi:rhodanese [Methylocella silvestris BL2]|uniref:Rhodanese n=1 Tax=Methylocella silvestris (strain DSM 15510 / CIP 108128 / LMG 27833 / NCIMB 13906 / BL2) TaxID=395965 RepID=B8EMG3_METSB|nr:rhodanese-like domain-containing protein [Methylocella silvestris]ACK52091.1 rhodanese [Methylocella silvestris BL2]